MNFFVHKTNLYPINHHNYRNYKTNLNLINDFYLICLFIEMYKYICNSKQTLIQEKCNTPKTLKTGLIFVHKINFGQKIGNNLIMK